MNCVPAFGQEGRNDPSFRIDLNSYPLYVKAGFSAADTLAEPRAGSSGWLELPPAGPTGRIVRFIDLDLPGANGHGFMDFSTHEVEEFTVSIPFEVSAALYAMVRPALPAAAPLILGIHLASLGDNWEIYLNGVPVRSELHLGPGGTLTAHRTRRDIFFPVAGSLFREGTNLLAIRIVADPSFPSNGMYQADPYYIAPYDRIERNNSELWSMMLIGLYLFLGLYHLFIFLVRRQDRYNLYYGLFSSDLALYLFARTHTIYELIQDGDLLFRLEVSSLSLILPAIGAFLESLNDNRVSRTTRIYALFCAALAIGQIVLPLNVAHDLLRIWQYTGLGMAIFYFGYRIVWRFFTDVNRRWKRRKGEPGAPSLALSYGTALVTTPLGNLLIGSFLLFASGVFDIIDALVLHFDLVLTQYGFFLFTMGTALILANRFSFLHGQLRDANHNLEGRIQSLTEARDELAVSERKYRSLFDGSSDPVALLDGELRFIEGNKAAVDFFGLDRPGRKGISLPDTLYREEREGSVPIDRLLLELEEKRRTGEAYESVLRLKTPLGEGQSCRVRLEFISSREAGEYLLHMSEENVDGLTGCFVEGRERYEIESTLAAADDVVRRVTANLPRYLGEDDANFLSICLREMVVNAVEHGNLEVGFDEKTEAQRAGRYFSFLVERRKRSAFRDRKVVVEYSISADRATYRISDEGPGFDHRALMKKAAAGPSPELLEHGRGIFMTLSAFDRIVYNERGNQVTLVKYFSSSPAEIRRGA